MRRRPLLVPPDRITEPSPRVWGMPVIPADVVRLSAVEGALLLERIPDWPGMWRCISVATGRVLDELREREILARYSPLTEVLS